MEDLVSTLTTGLIISLIFIALSYFFWKKFDKPTPLMIEREEERKQIKEERRMWRKVENQMKVEQEEAEERAAYERRKAEERARAIIPEKEVVTSAWSMLGVEKSTTGTPDEASGETFKQGDDANLEHRPVTLDASDLEQGDDADLMQAPDLVQVRQDEGVLDSPEEPDWELIERMRKLGEVSEEERDLLPEAPDLPHVQVLDEESNGDSPDEEFEPTETVYESPSDEESDVGEEVVDEAVEPKLIQDVNNDEGEAEDVDVEQEYVHNDVEGVEISSPSETSAEVESQSTTETDESLNVGNFDLPSPETSEDDAWHDVSWS
jgi:hypothetical protein